MLLLLIGGDEMKGLKELRKQKGISQMDCALLCNVSLLTWQLWERNIQTPNPENEKKLKNLFKIID